MKTIYKKQYLSEMRCPYCKNRLTIYLTKNKGETMLVVESEEKP